MGGRTRGAWEGHKPWIAAPGSSLRLIGLAGGLDVPRIEQRNAGKREVCNIAGDDRQTMNERHRCDQSVAFRTRIGNVKMRATLRHGCIDGEDATIKAS